MRLALKFVMQSDGDFVDIILLIKLLVWCHDRFHPML